MKLTKKLTSLLLAIVMCLTLGIPALAAEDVSGSVNEIHGNLTENNRFSMVGKKSGLLSDVYVYEGVSSSGIEERITETVYRNGEITLLFEEGTLQNVVKIFPSGDLYLDGNLVTVTRSIKTEGGVTGISPQVGYQHISSQTSLWPGADYSSFQYTESTSVNLEEAVSSLTETAFAIVISHVFAPLAFVSATLEITGLITAALAVYHAALVEKNPTSRYAYIVNSVYTTPTLVNPPNQYFLYTLRYYRGANYSGYVTGEVTYGALVQGI